MGSEENRIASSLKISWLPLFVGAQRPKIEPNFEAPFWHFLKEKPQNSYEPGGLVNSLVSGTPKIE